ncbi:SRPBCC family protein [Nakamurella sp. YIM 132087]|uniref:SRPBCC family protein n=1 Tax=Nakamurella alba TaxID=2665158 RepID=A0A7K1FKG1_9ACTN|nr:SRPBCC family protein [Nakamurella alba]MTD14631.1 SRPBCC family protein [Nakamurella alba]
MISVERHLECGAMDVFRVLDDGWLYASWVVGASRIREVEPGWPAAGHRIHHSVGVWPVLMNDVSEVLDHRPPTRMELQVRVRPWWNGVVTIEVRDERDGCVIRMTEAPVAGPARWLPRFLLAAFLRPRNNETLRRLGYLAEGGAGRRLPADGTT